MQPLTEQALGEHLRLMDEQGDHGSIYRMAVGLDHLARMPSPSPSLRRQQQQITGGDGGSSKRMEKNKLAGVIKYLRNQLTLTQESLPGAVLAEDEACELPKGLDSVAENRGDTSANTLASPAVQRRYRRSTRRESRRGLRGVSSQQQQTEDSETNETSLNRQQELTGAGAASMHLATIHALPRISSASNSPATASTAAAATTAKHHTQSRRPGIFSKGKAVASNIHDDDVTPEVGYLRRTSSTKSHARAPQLQRSDQRRPASTPASRSSRHIAVDCINSDATAEPGLALSAPDTASAIDMTNHNLGLRGQPCSSYVDMYDAMSDGVLERSDVLYRSHASYTGSPFVPQSCPLSDRVQSDNSHSLHRPSNDGSLHGQASSLSSQPRNLTSSSTHLLNSIEECLNEDVAAAATAANMDIDENEGGYICGSLVMATGAADTANLSFIFDEPYGQGDDSRDLIGNMSNTALSAFGSNIFSSNPDMASARHVGERTVSDFNNSLYRRHRPLYQPSADRHISFGDLRDESYEILPEYQPQTELPPPYPQSNNNSSSFINNRSRQFRGQSSLHEPSLFNRSRGAISLSGRSEEGSARRSALRYDVNNVLYTGSSGSMARQLNNASDETHTRFQYYPRQLN